MIDHGYPFVIGFALASLLMLYIAYLLLDRVPFRGGFLSFLSGVMGMLSMFAGIGLLFMAIGGSMAMVFSRF